MPWANWKDGSGKAKGKGRQAPSSSPRKKQNAVTMSGADRRRAELAEQGQASANRERPGRKKRVATETDTDATGAGQPSTDDHPLKDRAITLSDSSSSLGSSDEEWERRKTKGKQKETLRAARSSSPMEDSARIAIERDLLRLQQGANTSPELSRAAAAAMGRRPVAVESDSSDLEFDEPLAPELEAARRKAKALRRQSGLQVVEKKGPVDVVVITKADSIMPDAPGWRAQYERPVTIRINNTDTLEQVYKQVAQAKAFGKGELVLTYDFHEVIPYAKPSTFKILPGSTFNLRGWHRPAFERWKADRNARRNEPVSPVRQAGADSLAQPTPPSATRAEAQDDDGPEPEQEDDGPREGHIRLTLRGPQASVHVQVKPTKGIDKLLQHYFKTQGIEPNRQHRFWLELEGEKLNLKKTVGDYEDLEDEETIDVREKK